MPRADRSLPIFKHECLKCGRKWDSNYEHPKQCPDCRSDYWWQPYVKGKPLEAQTLNDLIQNPVDHSTSKNLPFIGAKCPYCKGTTGLDTFRVVAFCYSCDFVWTIEGMPKGVLQGIGLR